MSTPPMTQQEAIRHAGITRTPDGQLEHCAQPMHNAQNRLHRCTICHITIQRLDATNPANIPGSGALWIITHSQPGHSYPGP